MNNTEHTVEQKDWKEILKNHLLTHAVSKGSFKMQRDDMSHMEVVFLPIDRDRPSLPYDEFITEGGKHPATNGIEGNVGGHFYAKYKFPNGKGASVVCGQLFYSRIDAPYEVMLDDDDEPYGYQTDEELMIILAKAIGDM